MEETIERARRPVASEPVNIIVVGVGHLGKQHARVYRELDGARLVGVVDADTEKAREIGTHLDVPYYHELTPALLSEVHAASVVTPTPMHFDVASRLISAGVSVLVEKPMTSTLEEARELLEIARRHGVTLQVGHIERFNPVVLAALPHIQDPIFIECDRIHPFSFRSVETSVVLDLMIHDIDIVLNLVNSPVAQLDAVGTRVLSGTEDLANARLTFENGCTAMFKASRVAIQKNRKLRIFSVNAYISLDYVAKTGMRISLKEGFDRDKIDFKKMATLEESQGAYPLFTQYFNIEQLSISSEEPLKGELQAFLLAVRTGRTPVVTGEHGVQAIDIATRILEQIHSSQEAFLRRRQISPPR
ncbi:MAG TPA: Gfo/Idh/MocA family oxidoreductase [Planctomycetota bacterium]|nr:Gfo/Idh/MocA family oxidoreductase [Planctomycetota bacterium]